jgi:hypothetical protein
LRHISGRAPRADPFRTIKKNDASLKSCLFTFKYPRKFPGQRFALELDKKDAVICCPSERAQTFSRFLLQLAATQAPD